MICNINLCTGCGACAILCPAECIEMTTDESGFYVPNICNEKCIDCGICKIKCPQNITINHLTDYESKAYAFIHCDNNILLNSSSGGAFMALAEFTIKKCGYVFGAIYDDSFAVVTKSTNFINGLLPMQGSKYVECLSVDSYRVAKKYLDEGKQVLYTGTPCRIAGLYSVLGNKAYSNLITVEILCHGVPSNKLFMAYLSYVQDRYGKIFSYTFRDKSKWGWGAWGNFHYKKGNKEKVHYFSAKTDYYYSMFYTDNCFRESCYRCKYACQSRVANITIGDCWGIEKIWPVDKYKNGVSIIVTNNLIGEHFIFDAVGTTNLSKLDMSWVIQNNPTFIKPTRRPTSRDKFYGDFIQYGFIYSAKKYVKIQRFMPLLLRYVPRKLKTRIKRIIYN